MMMKRILSLMSGMVIFLQANCQTFITDKRVLLDSLTRVLQTKYVFNTVAEQMISTIGKNQQNGKYDTILSDASLAAMLTKDMQAISRDQHLKISFEVPSTQQNKTDKPKGSYKEWITNLMTENNYGIKDKEILEGNIGYLNMVLFGPLEYCADSIAAAMKFIQHTDALIIDLRSCRGSLDENTIPFICGYFFKESVQLSDFYDRSLDFTKQFWTSAWVPGQKFLSKPIYLLTSGRTFSGGEAFAYDLQQLKKAFILGEPTRGGAHPTELLSLGQGYKISVPYARTINPVTRSDWEGSGVKPDSCVQANVALYAARNLALKKIFDDAESIERKQEVNKLIADLQHVKPVLKKINFELQGYPDAEEVYVSGSFNFYSRKGYNLKKQGDKWIGNVAVEKGELTYVFVVDGQSIPDPANPKTTISNGNVNSVMIVD